MKQLFFIAPLLLFNISSFAQDNVKIKQKELGITFQSLNNFGLVYRFGTNQAMWQLNSLVLSGSSYERESEYTDVNRDRNSFQAGIDFSREFRRLLTNDFEFRYGAGISLMYNSTRERILGSDPNTQSTEIRLVKSKSYQPGVFLIIGANYILCENLILGAAIMPTIYYQYLVHNYHDYEENMKSKDFSSGLNYRLNLQTIRLSLAYRFN